MRCLSPTLILVITAFTGCQLVHDPYPIRKGPSPSPAPVSAPARACAWGDLAFNGRNVFDHDRSEYRCDAVRSEDRAEHDLAFYEDGSGYSSLHPGAFRRTRYTIDQAVCTLALSFDGIEEFEFSQPFIDVNGRLASFYSRNIRTQAIVYFACSYYLTVRN